MRFSTIANLGNAPAIHNQNIVVKTCQSPAAAHQQPTEPTQSLWPVRACLAPISPQRPHMVFAPPELVSPPISPQSTLLFDVIYQNREKSKSAEKITWLRLVSKIMRFSQNANFGCIYHTTSISLSIFSSRHGCIPYLQIQMDYP